MSDLILQTKNEIAQAIEQQPPEFPSTRFSTIVIDPPWQYSLRESDATHRNRCPYPPMRLDEILALPVPMLAEEDSVIWLWVTNNFLKEGLECLDRWGFEQKGILTWVKVTKRGTPHIGVGHWLRNCTEHCLLAVRGNVKSFMYQRTMTNESTVILEPRREHSRKPEEFYRRVNKLCPGSKLEMFARTSRPGWTVWGGEVNKFEETDSVRAKI